MAKTNCRSGPKAVAKRNCAPLLLVFLLTVVLAAQSPEVIEVASIKLGDQHSSSTPFRFLPGGGVQVQGETFAKILFACDLRESSRSRCHSKTKGVIATTLITWLCIAATTSIFSHAVEAGLRCRRVQLHNPLRLLLWQPATQGSRA